MIAVVDTETTGLSPRTHEVIDVHVLLVTDDLAVIVGEAGGRSPLLRPEAATPEALAVNRYDAEEWARTERPLAEILPAVLALIGCADTWLGSNPGFDVGFVAAAARTAGVVRSDWLPASGTLIDTAATARRLDVHGAGRRPHSLDALCELFEIDSDGAHSARADCLRTLEVYRRLTGGRSAMPDIERPCATCASSYGRLCPTPVHVECGSDGWSHYQPRIAYTTTADGQAAIGTVAARAASNEANALEAALLNERTAHDETRARLADLARTHQATLDRLRETERRLAVLLEHQGAGRHTSESRPTATEALRTAKAAIDRAIDACEPYRRGGGIGEVRR